MASEFGVLLRQLRRAAELTQEDLEHRSGVSVRTIRGLETGRRSNPRMTTVLELADALPLGPGDREKLLDAATRRPPDRVEQNGHSSDDGHAHHGGHDSHGGPAHHDSPHSHDSHGGHDRSPGKPGAPRVPGHPGNGRPEHGAASPGAEDGPVPGHPHEAAAPDDPVGAASGGTGTVGTGPVGTVENGSVHTVRTETLRTETVRSDEPAVPAPGPGPADGPSPGPRPADGPGPAAADAVEQLARHVAGRWRREEEQRQIQDPFPLPVRWRTGPAELTDHWANILRLPAGAEAQPPDLAGRLDDIAKTYRAIPSGRLVVLGRSGSGKTILALRFVLDLLAARTRADPVPVIFSVGAWNPTTQTLRDWLTGRLTRDHPGYATRGQDGHSLAAELIESGRVLPVLDGFDEMADGLRRPALEALNETTLPLVLTSRPDEYAAAVGETDVLTAAATVTLTDLTLDDLVGYLPRTTRRSGPAGSDTNAWDSVLAELRAQPQSAAGAQLAAVLATPLMVALARTVYSDNRDLDPRDLLDTGRFGSRQALADHLLDSYLPTVYRPRPDRVPAAGGRLRNVDPDRARQWLGHLAHHLSLQSAPDLAWWRLGSGLRRSTRSLVTAVVTACVIGLFDFVAGLTYSDVAGAFVDASIVGPLAGFLFGFVHWLTFTGRHVPRPAAVRLRLRSRTGRTGPHRWRSGQRLAIGVLGGAVFGFCYGFAVGQARMFAWHLGLAAGLFISIVNGLLLAVAFGTGTGLTFCSIGLLETPLDLSTAVSPRGLLAVNRRTVLAQMLVWAPVFGAVVVCTSMGMAVFLQEMVGRIVWEWSHALRLGVVSGIGGAMAYALAFTAWGQWAILGRLWLPLTGQLPWALVAFLEDAYQRGVLRQAGAVYQFRHLRLQDRLADTHRARGSRGFHPVRPTSWRVRSRPKETR